MRMENGGAPAATDKVPWRRAQTITELNCSRDLDGRKPDKWVGDGDARPSLQKQNEPREVRALPSIDQPGWRASRERLRSRTGLERCRHPSGSGPGSDHPVSGPSPEKAGPARTHRRIFELSEQPSRHRRCGVPAVHSGAHARPRPDRLSPGLPVTFGEQSHRPRERAVAYITVQPCTISFKSPSHALVTRNLKS